jgi:riboflavin transporter FmnP
MAKQDVTTKRIATVGVLSALGAVLMLIEIPYPFIPFLTFDLSDVVVLVIFVRFGWKDAMSVGLLKAVVHLLFKGAVGPIAIGQITAFIASMSYVLGMYLTTNKLNLNRFLGAVVTILIVTTILTVGNYLFITPIWFGGTTFLDVQDWVTPDAFGLSVSGGYLATILIAYVPFNLLKGLLITGSFLAIDQILKQLQ